GCPSRWTHRSASKRSKMLWRVTENQTSSTRIKAASSLLRHSPACLPKKELRSAWMAKAPGGTTYSSNVCGEASNTKRRTCGLTRASTMPAFQSDGISTSTTPDVHTRALTAMRPIRPTSQSCRSAWQHNPGRRPTYQRGNSVQKFGTAAHGHFDFDLTD